MNRSYRFRHFLYCNLILFSLQICLVYAHSGSFISAIPLPRLVTIELLLTLAVHCLLCIALSGCQALWMWGLREDSYSPRMHTLLFSLINLNSTIALLATNAFFFPLSLFARGLFPTLSRAQIAPIMGCSWVLLGLFSYQTFCIGYKKNPLLTCLLPACLLLIGFGPLLRPTLPANQTDRAHIILIGIDSLNPNAINPVRTPTLARFIAQSAWFKETISPLARTYPAWSTLLTGLYPNHHQARYNLLPPTAELLERSIAHTLQTQGYHTVFATDDRRFNSINEAFGFQTVIGPKRGVNDILLGAFNDFPLSNLLVNHPIGQLLFPYNHMNRASFVTYYPATFNRGLTRALATHPVTQPLFLAVHFALPHWPYAFAASDPKAVNDEYRMTHRKSLYDQALQHLDHQVAYLLHTLDHQGYLDNSLVILLSDHGETLFTAHSRPTPLNKYQGHQPSALAEYFKQHTATPLTRSAGHGSDLLSPAQYHCLLAAQIHQHKRLISAPQVISERIALVDLAPTLLAFAHLNREGPVDGISLLPTILSSQQHLPQRHFILESGMLPNQYLSKQTARRLGQQYFTVTQHGLLEIRTDQIPALDRQKLYGIIQGDWLLALYPTQAGYLPVLQQLSTHAWIDSLQTPFAQHSPAAQLLQQLSLFYHYDWSQHLIVEV